MTKTVYKAPYKPKYNFLLIQLLALRLGLQPSVFFVSSAHQFH